MRYYVEDDPCQATVEWLVFVVLILLVAWALN